MALLFTLPRVSTIDLVGEVAPRATLEFFATGTTTVQPVYSDSGLTTALAQPVTASDAGLFPAIYLNEDLPRYKIVCKDANGAELWTVDPYITTPTPTQAAIGAALYPRTTSEISVGVTPANYAYQEGHLYRYLSTSQRTDYDAGATTLDLTTPLQNMLTVMTSRTAYMPKGFAKITSTLTLPAATTLRGEGALTRIAAYGCDAISITGDFASVQNLQIHSFSSIGAADPKVNLGIKTGGVNGTQRNHLIFRDVYLRGFLRCFDLTWTWTTVLENCATQFCVYGVRFFGVGANNHITNCRFETNGGTACILTQKDTGQQGEGLFISGTFLAASQNGIVSDGYLSIGIDAASMVDLITGTGFDLTGVQSFKCDAQWIYADGGCFNFRDPGAPTNIAATICVGRATTEGASSSLLTFAANNIGLAVIGGEFVKTGATGGYPMLINGSSVAIVGSNITNASSNPEIRFAGTDSYAIGVRGAEVEWATSPLLTAASAATVSLPLPRSEPIQIVTITGTTNITTLNSVSQWAGKTVVLKFADVLTLTDGGNMRLNGNFVTSADDTCTLISDGTVWYEVARSAN